VRRQLDQAIGGVLLATASIGFSVFVPLAFPSLDRNVARAILAGCIVLTLVGLFLAWRALRRPDGNIARPVTRRWAVVGFGQGWIEIRVRNNDGDALVISANPGDSADQIAFDLTCVGERRPRRSEFVEIVFEVDGEPFELDIPDGGSNSFGFRAKVWRDLEYLRRIISAMRRGNTLRLSIAALAVYAEFTLDGAYEALEDVENLGIDT
jgi:hypothetical protein